LGGKLSLSSGTSQITFIRSPADLGRPAGETLLPSEASSPAVDQQHVWGWNQTQAQRGSRGTFDRSSNSIANLGESTANSTNSWWQILVSEAEAEVGSGGAVGSSAPPPKTGGGLKLRAELAELREEARRLDEQLRCSAKAAVSVGAKSGAALERSLGASSGYGQSGQDFAALTRRSEDLFRFAASIQDAASGGVRRGRLGFGIEDTTSNHMSKSSPLQTSPAGNEGSSKNSNNSNNNNNNNNNSSNKWGQGGDSNNSTANTAATLSSQPVAATRFSGHPRSPPQACVDSNLSTSIPTQSPRPNLETHNPARFEFPNSSPSRSPRPNMNSTGGTSSFGILERSPRATFDSTFQSTLHPSTGISSPAAGVSPSSSSWSGRAALLMEEQKQALRIGGRAPESHHAGAEGLTASTATSRGARQGLSSSLSSCLSSTIRSPGLSDTSGRGGDPVRNGRSRSVQAQSLPTVSPPRLGSVEPKNRLQSPSPAASNSLRQRASSAHKSLGRGEWRTPRLEEPCLGGRIGSPAGSPRLGEARVRQQF